MSPTDPLILQLSQHETFVRRVLHALLRNDAEVDDVVQETWIRALKHGHVPGRAWLATMARNVAISRQRSEYRRSVREERRVMPENVVSPDVSAQRVEGRQRIVAELLALDEPYRSVVLMKYEENMSVAEISEALGRSQSTVRSQLSRAHGTLRERLDAEFGDRRHWAALALPAAGLKSGGGAAATVKAGGWSWSSVAAWAAAVFAAVGVGWALIDRPGVETPATVESAMILPVDLPGFDRSPVTLASLEPIGAGRKAAAEAAASREAVATSEVQGEEVRPYEERMLPRAELLSRSYYRDYEKATFSFPFGLRDDPGLALTHNRWSVLFDNGDDMLDFGMPRHGGCVVDLGRVAMQAAAELDVKTLSSPVEEVKPQVGHTYFVRSDGAESELASLVHVVEYTPDRSCAFDWYSTDGTGRAQGSIRDDRVGKPIVDALVEWRALLDAGDELKVPEVLLELRAGAGGGNPNRVDMTGAVNGHVDRVASAPIDFSAEIQTRDPSVAYFEGGVVGATRALVVTSIDYQGTAKGDSNGHGEFLLVVGGTEVAHFEDLDEPFADVWTGRIVVVPGAESETYLEVANSSSGTVRLGGYFEEREALGDAPFKPDGVGFLGDHQLASPEAIPVLKAPLVELQIRNWRGGGNPNKIDMSGKPNMRIDEMSKLPLDLWAPLKGDRISRGFARGGLIPPGQRFVITHARMSGMLETERERDYARLYLGHEALIDVSGPTDTIAEVWTGEASLVEGEESRLFLEVADGASVSVVLEGRFETRD